MHLEVFKESKREISPLPSNFKILILEMVRIEVKEVYKRNNVCTLALVVSDTYGCRYLLEKHSRQWFLMIYIVFN